MGPGVDSTRDRPITVASFDFTESAILAEIYGQALRMNGYPVRLAHEVGPRELVEPALQRGLVELVPEYMGTALEFLNQGAGQATADVRGTHQALIREFARRDVTVLEPAPAQDTNGIAVTRETSARFDLLSISDLAPIANQLVLGGPAECPERPLCLEGFEKIYGLRFRSFLPLDASGPVTAAALQAGEVDVAVLFTTSGYLAGEEFVLLADDRGLQPADNVVPVVRAEVLRRFGPGLQNLLNSVSRLITTEALTGLNRSVSLAGQSPREAALEWLRSSGFAAEGQEVLG